MKRLVYELKGTPMEVSPGDIIDRFIEGLKSAPRRNVETNAPTNWWTTPSDLFDKAMQYEINHSAATTAHSDAQLNALSPATQEISKNAGRGYGGARGRRGGYGGRGAGREPSYGPIRGGRGGFRGRGRGFGPSTGFTPYSRALLVLAIHTS